MKLGTWPEHVLKCQKMQTKKKLHHPQRLRKEKEPTYNYYNIQRILSTEVGNEAADAEVLLHVPDLRARGNPCSFPGRQ